MSHDTAVWAWLVEQAWDEQGSSRHVVCMSRQGKARRVKSWQSRRVRSLRGTFGPGMAWTGNARQSRLGESEHVAAERGEVWQRRAGSARQGESWCVLAWQRMAVKARRGGAGFVLAVQVVAALTTTTS